MSSFKRCRGALSIAFDDQPTDSLLHDAPAVQKLLKWLSAREQGQKWLVVFDNADELEQLNLTHIIPQNALAGSVIITSQDGQAAKLIQRAKRTAIDKMEIEEGKALLANSMNTDLSEASLDTTSHLEKLYNRLDGIALALDLAGARIRDDMDISPHLNSSDTGSDVVDAIEQYLADLGEHAKSMLSDPEYKAASAYKKTIWNVWETTLSSLKRSEQRGPDYCDCAMHLLTLAVVLGPTIVHEEVFRAASQSLQAVCNDLRTGVTIPPWFKALLQVKSTGVWDSHIYRTSIARLQRFNLVRAAAHDIHTMRRTTIETHSRSVSWPGFTIHSLVRWCTRAQTPQAEYDMCSTILVTSCSRTWNRCGDGIDFRYALLNYTTALEFQSDTPFTERGFAAYCTTLGKTLLGIHEIYRTKHFLECACMLKRLLFGEAASETIDAEIDVRTYYHLCALSRVESEKRRGGTEEAKDALRRILEHPEGKIRIAAADGRSAMLTPQHLECMEENVSKSTEEVYRTLRGVTLDKDELPVEFISEQHQALELAVKRLGQHDHVVNALRLNLAKIYFFFSKFDLAKKHLEDLSAREQESLGKFDDRRLQTMEMLAICEMRAGNSEAATELMREVCNSSRTALGRHDPRTRLRERHLQRLDNGEWKVMLHSGSGGAVTDPDSQGMAKSKVGNQPGLTAAYIIEHFNRQFSVY